MACRALNDRCVYAEKAAEVRPLAGYKMEKTPKIEWRRARRWDGALYKNASCRGSHQPG
jgi:hypothetical protein